MEPTNTISCRHCGQRMNVAADLLGREVACQHCGKSTLIASPSPAGNAPSGSEIYNIVTDTVIGVNVRWKDNVVQFAVIAACVPVGILIGALAMEDWRPVRHNRRVRRSAGWIVRQRDISDDLSVHTPHSQRSPMSFARVRQVSCSPA